MWEQIKTPSGHLLHLLSADIENRSGQRERRLASPELLAAAPFAAHTLIVTQAAQEADLGGEDAVVGDLEQQLLTWTVGGGAEGREDARQAAAKE